MSDLLKAAMALGAAILVATSIMTCFSPYQSCMRAHSSDDPQLRALVCARALGERS